MNVLKTFSQNTQISNSTKIIPVRAKPFHEDGETDGRMDGRADGQTGGRQDMAKLIAVLRNFANSSKNGRRYERILQAGLKFVVYI
jgi:hypothetical protein